MLTSNSNAMGIIFPNSYDSLVPELVADRLMASIPFAARYRLIDFTLSSMVNCGIDNISIIVRNNYHSLMDHLGAGREWDLTRKNGGLTIFPPFAEKSEKIYTGRVEALANILPFLRSQKEKYIILSDTNFASAFDFKDLLQKHIASGADVTCAYTEEELPVSLRCRERNDRGFYYTYATEGDRIKKIYVNLKEAGIQKFAMNICVMSKDLLIDLVNTAFVRGQVFFMRDILAPQVDNLVINGYKCERYVARISGLKGYFDENMKLLEDNNLDELFGKTPIYTKIRDDNPTRYIDGANAKNVLVADGCVIEGEIENSILFRGVHVHKGAKVKNCILMQDTVIGENAVAEYMISDKSVTVSAGKTMKGESSFPLFIPKGHTV